MIGIRRKANNKKQPQKRKRKPKHMSLFAQAFRRMLSMEHYGRSKHRDKAKMGNDGEKTPGSGQDLLHLHHDDLPRSHQRLLPLG